MKPFRHAESSAKKFGGNPADYIDIHNKMDETKSIIGDNRHRFYYHSAYGIFTIEKLFGMNFALLDKLAAKFGWTPEEVAAIISWKESGGTNIKNSDGKEVSVRDVAEQHCVEDFKGFIPSLQDYLQEMEIRPWMNNGMGVPPSQAKIVKTKEKRTVQLID